MSFYTTVCSPQLFRSPENLLFRFNLFPWINDLIDITKGMTLTLKNPAIFFQIVKGAPYSEGPELLYNQIDYSPIANQHADFVNIGEAMMYSMFICNFLPLEENNGITYSGNYPGYTGRYGNYPDNAYLSVLNTYALFSNYWNTVTEYNIKKDSEAGLNIAKRSNIKACFLPPGVYNAAHLSGSWNLLYNFSQVVANENRLPAYLGYELIQYS